MLKIKRPAIIGMLLILLVFTGYLNHQLTQQALRKTSKDYKRHEIAEREKYMEGNKSKEDIKDIEIVNAELDNADVSSVIDMGNEGIKEAISREHSGSNKNYFVEYRLSRDKLRAGLVERLDTIVNNKNTDDKMRNEAQTEIINIGRVAEKELQIEGLVKSKGFDEALVFLTDKDIKVVVGVEELSEQDMMKILEIVKMETEYDTNDIKIIKK